MLTHEASKGQSIYHAACDAIRLAREGSREVALIFNDVRIVVSPHSFADDIAMIYSLKMTIVRLNK